MLPADMRSTYISPELINTGKNKRLELYKIVLEIAFYNSLFYAQPKQNAYLHIQDL